MSFEICRFSQVAFFHDHRQAQYLFAISNGPFTKSLGLCILSSPATPSHTLRHASHCWQASNHEEALTTELIMALCFLFSFVCMVGSNYVGLQREKKQDKGLDNVSEAAMAVQYLDGAIFISKRVTSSASSEVDLTTNQSGLLSLLRQCLDLQNVTQ